MVRLAARGHGIAGVDCEVQQRVLELTPIEPREHGMLRKPIVQLCVLAERTGEQVRHVTDDLIEVEQ